MARILFATVPISGHVRPGLAIARAIASEGHEVAWYTGRKFEPLISRTGARFLPMTANVGGNAGRLGSNELETDVLQSMTGPKTGLAGFKRIIRELFVDTIPGYAADLAPLIDEFQPDVVVVDHCFLAGPLLARQRRIKNVVYVVGPLAITGADTAPSGTGLPPSSSVLGRARNRVLQVLVSKVLFRDVQRAVVRATKAVGVPPIDAFLTDWTVRLADRYLVASVPEFEYSRRDLPAAVEFVGPVLPADVDDWAPPTWWPELDRAREAGRPVILVTQGTAAVDPTQLVLPSIRALAGKDALIVATTVDSDPDLVLPPDQRPTNLRLERFVPFTEILPMTDLMITNGGYGGVQMSLAFGVPLVTAGQSEDKMEVNQRVQSSGAGLSLRTSEPTVEQIAAAVTKVLAEPTKYRARAQELQRIYARYPGTTLAAEAILQTAGARRAAADPHV